MTIFELKREIIALIWAYTTKNCSRCEDRIALIKEIERLFERMEE